MVPYNDALSFTMSNNSNLNSYDVGPASDYVLNYTDTKGLQIALVGPPGASRDLDWAASSFGVSTQCAAIPFDACTLSFNREENVNKFNCTVERGGIDVDGNLTGYAAQFHYFDAHKFIAERSGPFGHSGPISTNLSSTIGLNLTDEDANDVFRNPWRSLNMVSILEDIDTLPSSFHTDPGVWHMEDFPYLFMVLQCNFTGKSSNLALFESYTLTYISLGH